MERKTVSILLRRHKRNFGTWGFFKEGNVSQVNRICLWIQSKGTLWFLPSVPFFVCSPEELSGEENGWKMTIWHHKEHLYFTQYVDLWSCHLKYTAETLWDRFVFCPPFCFSTERLWEWQNPRCSLLFLELVPGYLGIPNGQSGFLQVLLENLCWTSCFF